ncbi:MAG: DNA polymerase III subunit delta', partial [Desulfurivibrionaceae bacterium]|nr:DNA polymerase III subunit delta' [Desulfurivibrionaceae bacterium]
MIDDDFTIASVLGQDKAKKMLRGAVRSHRLSHAYLFRGPAGVGKKTLARAFGNYLNCQAPVAGQDACGSCRSCRKLKSGNHPDLLLVEPDGAAIKIKQIRELKHALTFPPFEAKYRIVLIADVHTMRREAANSLLKILEEPPPGNQLILSGDEAGDILPTILSRCQIIPFTSLARVLVADRLAATGIAPDEAASLAAIADGSLGRAKTLADSELLETRRAIIAGLLEMKQAKRPAAATVFALAEQAAGLADRLPDLLDLVKLWFRDLIMLANHLPEEIVNRDLPGLADRNGVGWTAAEL